MLKMTLAIIKPDAVKRNLIGKILTHIINAGFQIKGLKLTLLTKKDAKIFYEIHKKRIFFNKLIEFIVSGPILVIILEKENAVLDFRNLIGSTNPYEANIGTIRKIYGESIERNIIHGSDSDLNAVNEISFFFSKREIL